MSSIASAISKPEQSTEAMLRLAAELFPWHRSISGAGLRRTLQRLADEIPLTVHEVPTGERVLDFTIPQEWRIRDAWIADQDGERVVDYSDSNLHVVSYSQPFDGILSWSELDQHLHSLPEDPHWIPYRTAYLRYEWGFCLPDQLRQRLASLGADRRYQVRIDAEFVSGALSYGECLLPGDSSDEFLLSAHVCHPSLANDNLSAIAVLVELAKWLMELPRRRFTYRLLFAPATFGAIAWLSRNRNNVHRIRHGLVLAQLGDAGPLTYKTTRSETADIDRAMACLLKGYGTGASIRRFDPFGYDERQFCSPGFNLPVGRLTRTPNGEYPEYHTSADNLDLLRCESLLDSLSCCQNIIRLLEANATYVRTNPYGEPQLGRHGLYTAYGLQSRRKEFEQAVLWLLNLADGRHSLLDMIDRSRMPPKLLMDAAEALEDHQLIARSRLQHGI